MKKGAKTHIPVRLPGKNFWLILLDYVFVPALLYLMTANWCVELFPATPRWMWVIVFVGINTLINVRGITYTARADWIMFYVEAVVLALFIGFGLNYVLGEGGGTGQLVMDPLYRPGEMNLQFIGLACTIACLSFLGFDGISTLAEETHRPEVTIGRATMAALLCIGFLFMLQTYVATVIQPDMSKMNPDTAFFDAAELAAGDWFRKVLLVVNILAVGIANTMNAQAATSRVLYGMSR
ncbi:APC family permease, partial [Desulfovibrio sp.]